MATATFEFQKSAFSSTPQADWGYDVVGIFGRLKAMKGKKVQFTKKNLKGENRVTLQIYPKQYADLAEAIADDEVEKLSCTTALSKVVRTALAKGATQAKVMSYLLSLEIQATKDDPTIYFLFNEKGDGEQLPAFLVDDAVKTVVTYEQLVAF